MARPPSPNMESEKIMALRLWMAGAEYREIAEELGVSRSLAYARVQQAIDDQRPHADYSAYRAVQLTELEFSRKRLREVISDRSYTLDDMFKAISTLIKLQEREAKLLGLDRAPTVNDEIESMSDAEVEAFIEQCLAETDTKS